MVRETVRTGVSVPLLKYIVNLYFILRQRQHLTNYLYMPRVNTKDQNDFPSYTKGKQSSHHLIPSIRSLLPTQASNGTFSSIALINGSLGSIAWAMKTVADQISRSIDGRRRSEGEVLLVVGGIGVISPTIKTILPLDRGIRALSVIRTTTRAASVAAVIRRHGGRNLERLGVCRGDG